MTTLEGIFERAPVERITDEARQVNVGRALAALVAVVLMFIGRTAGWMVTAVVWTFVAVRVGYRDVRPRPPTVSPPASRPGR
ncbi:hypothetical protein [Micromonospora sp. L32]|uniref:hypothetical protein n=1 Tax=Micromonospora sp. L32 TaxID=3452214 RepID=UPI003F88A317